MQETFAFVSAVYQFFDQTVSKDKYKIAQYQIK